MSLLRLYLSPQGRVSRRTYWWSLLVLDGLFSALFVLVEELLKTRLSNYWCLLIAWPGIAISIKRWHDRDKAGWWLLIVFVPVLGIWNLIESGFLPGTPGTNRFGSSPKHATSESDGIQSWFRRRRFREGKTLSQFIARDVRRDIQIVSAAKIDAGIVTARVRTSNVLYVSKGLIAQPDFEPAREMRIDEIWKWTGKSWGGLPDGTSIVERFGGGQSDALGADSTGDDCGKGN